MKVIRCDVCGSIKTDYADIRGVQIRKYRNEYDSSPKIEHSYDVCIDCISKIFEKDKQE